MRVLVSIALLACLSVPVSALEGRDDPAYQAAAGVWLSGDDYKSLSLLGDLARSGNAAAQILLGLAATRRLSENIIKLPRKERIHLLRKPGGLSGKSWLKVAANIPVPLAFALREALVPPFNFRKAVVLRDLGERETATRYLLEFSSRNFPTDAAASRHVSSLERSFPFAMQWIVAHLLNYQPSIRLHGDVKKPENWNVEALLLIRAREASGLQIDLKFAESWLHLLAGWTHRSTVKRALELGSIIARQPPDAVETRVLRRYCALHCPDSMTLCYAVAPAHLERGYLGLWEFTSPANGLISAEDYFRSERALLEFGRAMRDSRDRLGWRNKTPLENAAQCVMGGADDG